MSIASGAPSSGSASGPIRLSFAQSSATSTRSRQSSGSFRCSSSSGMNAYSRGSGASPYRYMTTSLPSCSSASFVAKSDPRASPSGFSWVTSRKRSYSRSASATAFRSFVVGVELIDQLCHSHTALDGWIVFELELGRPLHADSFGHPRLEHAVGRGEADEALFTFTNRAEHADIDPGMAQIARRIDAGHGHKSDPRILELADRHSEHFAERVVYTPHPLRHRASPPHAGAAPARTPARRGNAQRRPGALPHPGSPVRRRRRSAEHAATARGGRPRPPRPRSAAAAAPSRRGAPCASARARPRVGARLARTEGAPHPDGCACESGRRLQRRRLRPQGLRLPLQLARTELSWLGRPRV